MTQKLKKYGLIALACYGVFFLHDSNLYPHLSVLHRLVLSLLRLGLLLVPVTAAYLLHRNTKPGLRPIIAAAFIIFLPYTLYSITEVRHIAELCPIESGGYYFDTTCATASWKILPPLLYAFIGASAFVLSLFVAGIRTFRWHLPFIVLYCALASQFALLSRLNIWSIFSQPSDVITELGHALMSSAFWSNSLAFLILFSVITFIYLKICTHPRMRTEL